MLLYQRNIQRYTASYYIELLAYDIKNSTRNK